MFYDIYNVLGEIVPNDHSSQVNSKYYLDLILTQEKHPISDSPYIMDLGCGEGRSRQYVNNLCSKATWIGVDIADSPEAKQRKTPKNIVVFDGVRIPLANDVFDIVYSNQAFEHTRHPEKLLSEIYRTLKPNGYFVGSVSYLEPFHSYSLWNYTPYGFKTILETANIDLMEVRPGIDALTLIVRRGFGTPKFFGRWWEKQSPLNKLASFIGKIKKASPNTINSVKLLFCGQFSFMATKSRSL